MSSDSLTPLIEGWGSISPFLNLGQSQWLAFNQQNVSEVTQHNLQGYFMKGLCLIHLGYSPQSPELPYKMTNDSGVAMSQENPGHREVYIVGVLVFSSSWSSSQQPACECRLLQPGPSSWGSADKPSSFPSLPTASMSIIKCRPIPQGFGVVCYLE